MCQWFVVRLFNGWAGEHWDGCTHQWTEGGEGTVHKAGETLDKLVAAWHAAGATLIGGCCRVSPAVIKSMAAQVQQLSDVS